MAESKLQYAVADTEDEGHRQPGASFRIFVEQNK
jgi:hypothetical protein